MVLGLGSSSLLMLSRFKSTNTVKSVCQTISTDSALTRNWVTFSGLLDDKKTNGISCVKG